MNLYEYQAKELFTQFDIPILKNWVCSNVSEIQQYQSGLLKIGPPWVVKCQIYAGGRGKSGGVKIISSLEDMLSFMNRWLGKYLVTYQTTSTGEIVNSILIEPLEKIMHEFYMSISLDRDKSQIICMVSIAGGINIEKTAHVSPNLIHKIIIDPVSGAHPYQGRILACKLGLKGIQIDQFVKIYINTVYMFLKKDLILVEINPLIINSDNNLICLDSKISIDHNAIFRQSEVLKLCTKKKIIHDDYSLLSSQDVNINYVALDGNIGCMVNGAGLAMATMDLIKAFGGNPANFLDIGGDTDINQIILALKMLLTIKKIRVIFINIFGGIVCCDVVARGIITVFSKHVNHVPIVVRLEGNNAIMGSNKLINSKLNIIVINDLFTAIQKTIALAE